MKQQSVSWLIGVGLVSLVGCTTKPLPPPVVCACDDTVTKLAEKVGELHQTRLDLGMANEQLTACQRRGTP